MQRVCVCGKGSNNNNTANDEEEEERGKKTSAMECMNENVKL